jgi:hypothetical protein
MCRARFVTRHGELFARLGGGRPMALAFSATGELYVANNSCNSILK